MGVHQQTPWPGQPRITPSRDPFRPPWSHLRAVARGTFGREARPLPPPRRQQDPACAVVAQTALLQPIPRRQLARETPTRAPRSRWPGRWRRSRRWRRRSRCRRSACGPGSRSASRSPRSARPPRRIAVIRASIWPSTIARSGLLRHHRECARAIQRRPHEFAAHHAIAAQVRAPAPTAWRRCRRDPVDRRTAACHRQRRARGPHTKQPGKGWRRKPV